MNPMAFPIPLPDGVASLAVRFAQILLGLIRVVALRFPRTYRAAVALPLCLYISRTSKRLVRALLRAAAPIPPRKSRPGRPSGATPIRLPTRYGWLIRDLRHEAAVWRNQLESLLETDEAKAFLQAVPSAGRLLRPLCHMLALRPPVLRKPKPAPAPEPEPPSAAAPAALPPRPVYVLPEPPCLRLASRWPWVPIDVKKPA
jgi:hypothetical protein